jgi:asparagine synthase (glutamine-hydrolysing)
MCGVAAIYAFRSSAQNVNRAELHTIRDHMAARGPDGKGEWYSNDNRVGLGHRRLAIIDPDERSAQPMVTEDGKFVIVFNGEIYNFRHIRNGLEKRGHRFHTESDTEVLLALYAEKQEAMLDDLRGMFAFVIWDGKRKSLFMARDPYGIKPLYYADDGQTLRAASQVKALLAGNGITTAPDPAGIVGFHLFGSVPEPFTIYQNIRQLPAGYYLWVDERGVGDPKAYFSIAETYVEAECSSNMDSVCSQEVTRTALLDSVRQHLVSDVPVGAFLSAGIDSGSLVGLMRDAGARDIQTVTLAFDEYKDTDDDEAPLAERVAKQYGTRHITRRVGQAEFEQDLPRILEAMDQPSIDGLNTWFVSKAAAEQGLKVVVSGLGGDELFGGYPSFKDIPKWVRGLRVPGHVPLLGVAVRKIAAPLLGLTNISPKAAGMLELGGSWEGAWLLRRGLFMPWELPALLGEELAREGLQRLQPLTLIRNAMQPGPKSAFARIASMESALYMRNQLLRDSDWAGMAHSLEIRVPLVDAKLLAAIAGIPVRDSNWNKQRLALSPEQKLPDEVTQRAKTGFTTPVGEWTKSSLKGQSTINAAKTVVNGHWSRRWSRNVVAAWKM